MTKVTTPQPTASEPARPWREREIHRNGATDFLGWNNGLAAVRIRKLADGQMVAEVTAGAVTEIVDTAEIKDLLLGPISKDCYAAYIRDGARTELERLEYYVGTEKGWVRSNGELVCDLDAEDSVVAPLPSDTITLQSQSRLRREYVCVTDRPIDDLLASPRLFANIADTAHPLDVIEVVVTHDPCRPLFMRLIVDVVDQRKRAVIVKEVWRSGIERLLPRMPAPQQPPHE
jgi:hypothetical protein